MMIKLKIELTNEEYNEFQDLLEYCMNDGTHVLNEGIAEKMARRMEEGLI